MQLREHLHDLLYSSADGYFSRSRTPVGVLDAPINFTKLADFAHYQAVVRQAYQQLQVPHCCALQSVLPDHSLPCARGTTGRLVVLPCSNEQSNLDLQVSWLTPSELFSPHWGQAVARCILAQHSGSQPLRIVEIGAGSGTQARDILSFLRAGHPKVYADMTYRSVEISPALAQLQQQRVAEEAGHASRQGSS